MAETLFTHRSSCKLIYAARSFMTASAHQLLFIGELRVQWLSLQSLFSIKPSRFKSPQWSFIDLGFYSQTPCLQSVSRLRLLKALSMIHVPTMYLTRNYRNPRCSFSLPRLCISPHGRFSLAWNIEADVSAQSAAPHLSRMLRCHQNSRRKFVSVDAKPASMHFMHSFRRKKKGDFVYRFIYQECFANRSWH